MLKGLGRILLLIVSGLMIGFSIPVIINNVNYLNTAGWQEALTTELGIAALAGIIAAVINIIVALPALLAAIKGRIGFWGFIFAVLLGAGVVVQFITANNAGLLSDPNNIWSIILGCIYPILYALGTLFLIIGKAVK